MDRLLILGYDCPDEKERLKEAMYQLVDIYYDALDAPKSGKKVCLETSMIPRIKESKLHCSMLFRSARKRKCFENIFVNKSSEIFEDFVVGYS